MKGPFILPNNIKEGDYIEIGQLGAYSLTFRTKFNGFYSDQIFEVNDKPGVLSSITNRLARYKISIKRIIQTPDKKNRKATIVIITHKVKELNLTKCLKSFKSNNNLLKLPTLIRLF